MKRILSLTLAVLMLAVLALGFTACDDQNDGNVEKLNGLAYNPTAKVLDKVNKTVELPEGAVLSNGNLQIYMEVGYPPYEDYSSDGKTVIGFDADIAACLGKIFGCNVVLTDTSYEGIFDNLKLNKCDLVISGVTITAERTAEMDFSTPYVQNYQCLVAYKGTPQATADYSNGVKAASGLRVGHQGGTTSEDYIEAAMAVADDPLQCTLSSYEKMNDIFSDLTSNRLDLVICDSTVADNFIANDDNFVKVWVQTENPEEFGVAIKKGNSKLQTCVNEAMQYLTDEGLIEELQKLWLD